MRHHRTQIPTATPNIQYIAPRFNILLQRLQRIRMNMRCCSPPPQWPSQLALPSHKLPLPTSNSPSQKKTSKATLTTNRRIIPNPLWTIVIRHLAAKLRSIHPHHCLPNPRCIQQPMFPQIIHQPLISRAGASPRHFYFTVCLHPYIFTVANHKNFLSKTSLSLSSIALSQSIPCECTCTSYWVRTNRRCYVWSR